MTIKTIYIITAAIVLPILAAAQESAIVTDTIRSEILGTVKPYSVYLPAGYEKTGVDYPVLYLLHGASDDHTAWATKGNIKRIADRLITEGTVMPMVIVMPDARGTLPSNLGPRMGYFNRPGWNYEDFFFEEFVDHIENRYRIARTKYMRAISGLSMGGGGSMVYGQHRPDLFGYVCPLSALMFSPEDWVRNSTHDPAFIQSVQDNDAVRFIREASEEQLRDMKSVSWYIDCGDDDFLYLGNVEAYKLMREKHIPVQYRMRDGGHNWEYWQDSIEDVLKFISTGYGKWLLFR